MSIALCLPLLAGLALFLGARPLADRIPPATAVVLLTAAMLVTALATGFVLSVLALFVLGQVPLVARFGHWSAAVVGRGLPVPAAVGILAGAVVCVLFAAALRRATLSGRDLVLAAVACRRFGPATAGLVVLDDDLPDAYALPGLGGRVVVSTAMLRALPPAERRVLLAHENAHLAHRHHLYVQLAGLAAAADPLLRPAERVVRAAVERWADEVAAAEVGDRELAARALARAGLARAAARRTRVPAGPALAATDVAVADRARALLAGPPPRRRALAGALAALVLAVSVAALVTGVDTQHRFEAAEHAYHAAR